MPLRRNTPLRATKRGCAFSSNPLARTVCTNVLRGAAHELPHGIFSLFFPDDCRVCARALTTWTRLPVCKDCLGSPARLEADFFCAVCNTPFLNAYPLDEHGVCAACRSGLLEFDHAASFGLYEGPLRRLIHLFKYEGMKPLAHPLAAYLQQLVPDGQEYDAIVPVPLHWRKRMQRGFNQSEILARRLAKILSKNGGVPVIRALRRKRSTAVQAGLASAGRRRDVAGAFEAVNRSRFAGANLLLIDDVMTTGATASACAGALKRGGAKSVSLLTLARVGRRWRS